ncbi:hypothetical protein [Brumicola nitratireducens]|uniref:DUF1269 domain-containing protein n=1 Tax=Glaciecola nitratireducens (strain JCM 12485 / KCTC 12276 / FR1064) TaxID=1085623 RepID=G4QDR5_GLANF|nr:hypothetical protein [Glaciecola nitratireducens]AEP31094.1 hypothetical protein GNIT_2998 [Glaciecola nitratireducens FR1064]
MKRIYFLIPNIDIARDIVEELTQSDIDEKHIHIISKEGTQLEALPEATLLQKTDFISGLERGVAIGGTTGLLAGLATLVLPGGIALSGGAILACAAAGAGVGSWLGSMIALDVPNTRHKEFEEAISQGKLLMLLDVPNEKLSSIETTVIRHYPEAVLEKVETSLL